MHADTLQIQTSDVSTSARQNRLGNPSKRGPESRTGERPDVYTMITERMIALLEAGTVPWKKPWQGGEAGAPRNLVSLHAYSGINAFLLAMAPYSNPFWLTYNQAKNLGGFIKKGEKGFPVIYWNKKEIERRNENTGDMEAGTIAFIRYFTVFNLEQTEGIETPAPDGFAPLHFEPLETCEFIRKGYRGGPGIVHREPRAYYTSRLDVVNMPKPETFHSVAAYYATLFHELAHSTGHETRLNREGVAETHYFGDPVYSKEELIAEMGATFLCAHAGIAPLVLGNSAAYIAGWLKRLRHDKKMVIQAASAAQKAANRILGESEGEDEGAA
jgi:antirestriction protein ArdC